MSNTNPATDTAIESIRTFALSHGEVAFAHLCTAALAGEEWAQLALAAPLQVWSETDRGGVPYALLMDVIQGTDTTRPDGAVSRGGIEV